MKVLSRFCFSFVFLGNSDDFVRYSLSQGSVKVLSRFCFSFVVLGNSDDFV